MKDFLQQLLAGVPAPLARRNLVREYLQARILRSLQESGAFLHWAFVGGTALRFLYAIARFSEDLDFSLISPMKEDFFRKSLRAIRNEFESENYVVEIKVSALKVVHSAFIRFPGLLHELGLSSRPSEVIAVKVEVDTNPPAGAHVETSLVRRHATLNLSHYDQASLLAGKLHALLMRPYLKGRDLYDLVWYLSDRSWPAPNLELLNQALGQTGWAGPPVNSENWRGLLWAKLKDANWKAAIQDVRPFLERADEVELLTPENCRKLLRA